MPFTSRRYLPAVLVGIALACSDGPSGVSSGNLAVTVVGLPGSSSADLLITGPGGYSQALTASQTLSQLAPGVYTVAANNVTVGSAVYVGSPQSQTVNVGASGSSASVFYSASGAGLNLTINGLGTSSSANVTVTGPNSYSQSVTRSQILSGLNPGDYTITAQDVVATGGTSHSPTPATQTVTVPGVGSTSATVSYAPPSTGPLNLTIAGLYITQSTQTPDGAVPLVKDRNGFLRVFAVASRTTVVTEVPSVRVRIYNSTNVAVDSVLIPSTATSVPTTIDESQLSYSWNTPISGTLIQPGFRVEAEVNPAGTIGETTFGDNVLAPPAPVVRTVPALNLTFVPIVQKSHLARGEVGNVNAGNKEQFLALARKIHPLVTINSIVHGSYTTTTTDTLQSKNANKAWGTVLGELEALRVAENQSRYYYGVAQVSYSSGVAGVAYVSNSSFGEKSALGWDALPSGADVLAHELAHNWARNHAPCGNPTGLDAAYPYAGGTTGAYGVDVAAQSLKAPTTTDIMGYCTTKWISDYTYKGVLSYLLSPPPSSPMIAAAVSQAVQPCLLVWGHIRDGEVVLEPSFQVTTRPNLPRQPGPYSVEGRAGDGTGVFSLSFSPKEIADAEGTQQGFVFAVPMSDAQAARLTTIRLSGRGREAVRTTLRRTAAPGAQLSLSANPTAAQVRRAPGGKVGVQWDTAAHPMVMVRDAENGEILSFARDGHVEVSSQKRALDLVFSDGVKSTLRRVAVAPQ